MTDLERDLLILLDLIEAEENWELAAQRLAIVESYGYLVVVGEEISGRKQ